MIVRRTLITVLLSAALFGCGKTVTAPTAMQNSRFPTVRGESLKKEPIILPDRFLGKPVLLLVGYLQKSQFDIDRWILGVLQAGIPVQMVEVPTIAGMMPQMVQGFINEGMRSGIPQSDWGSVVTVYEDAPKIIQAIGNERPQSAHVVLLNSDGRIVWSSNIGYSAAQVLELKGIVTSLNP